MALKQDIENLDDQLKSRRDELFLQMHLADIDINVEWERTEYIREQFKELLAGACDESQEITAELAGKILVIADELGSTYYRIIERLKQH